MELPASLRTISQGAFARCRSLKRVKFGEGLETLGTNDYLGGGTLGAFEGSAVEHVSLPSTLRRIEYSAFEDCKNLKSIELPDALEYVGMLSFCRSGLESVVLPTALKTVQCKAFMECEAMKGSGSRKASKCSEKTIKIPVNGTKFSRTVASKRLFFRAH